MNKPFNQLETLQAFWNMKINEQLCGLETFLRSESYYEHEVAHPRRRSHESSDAFEMRKQATKERYLKFKRFSRQKREKVIQWVIENPYPQEEPHDL